MVLPRSSIQKSCPSVVILAWRAAHTVRDRFLDGGQRGAAVQKCCRVILERNKPEILVDDRVFYDENSLITLSVFTDDQVVPELRIRAHGYTIL